MTSSSFSRREFIKNSAGAMAMLSLGSAGRAENSPRNSDTLFRMGIIGAGNRAHDAHFPAIKNRADMKILGVCDVWDEHLERGLVAAGSGARGYTDYRKLLADPDIDAVIVCTPNHLHSEITIAALQAGKHVMCEKPMGLSMAQRNAMQSAADAAGKVFLAALQLRYSPYYHAMRGLIEAGKIGQPKHLLLILHRGDWWAKSWLYTDPKTGRKINWRYSQAASGGPLLEEGCHYFDIMHWMAGAVPQTVQCKGATTVYRDGRDTWDQVTTTLGYPGGCMGTLDMCVFGPNHLELQVVGEKGALRGNLAVHTLQFESGTGSPEKIALPPEIGHGRPGQMETAVLRMYQDFVEHIVDHERIPNTTGMAACKTGWLGELSNRLQRPVGWDEIGADA